MAKAKAKGKKRKAPKEPTINLKLRVSVEPGVKRITSRQRQNLREMRKGMITQAQATGRGQQQLVNPAFYGGIKPLMNNAMNTLQNQRYALESDIRAMVAERNALNRGGGGAPGAGDGGGGGGGGQIDRITQQIQQQRGQLDRIMNSLAQLGQQTDRNQDILRRTRDELRGVSELRLSDYLDRMNAELLAQVERRGGVVQGVGVTPVPESARDPTLAGTGNRPSPQPTPQAPAQTGQRDISESFPGLVATPASRSRVQRGFDRVRGRTPVQGEVVVDDPFAAGLEEQQAARAALQAGLDADRDAQLAGYQRNLAEAQQQVADRRKQRQDP